MGGYKFQNSIFFSHKRAFESVEYRIRARCADGAGRVAAVIQSSAYLLLGDDTGIEFHREHALEIRNGGIEHASGLQNVAEYELGALAAVHALYAGDHYFFFHFAVLFLSGFLSLSECIKTPIELADIAAAHIDGCSIPIAATGILIIL